VDLFRPLILRFTLPGDAHGVATMVARRERGAIAGDVAFKGTRERGASSIAERRAAKQRVRREKKRVEKKNTTTAGVARANDGNRELSSDSDRRGHTKRAPSEASKSVVEDDEIMPDAPYEYVGMFLDDGVDSDDAISSDDDDDDDETVEKRKTARLETGDDVSNAPVERARKNGSFGNYGKSDGRMRLEDDEWATSERTWSRLSPYLEKFHSKKVWMPFYYDGGAGDRLRKSGGFTKVIHRREDFFQRVRDTGFTKSIDIVIDNPPYTGKGMKEKILRALVDANLPFCLLLPIGVLHGSFARDVLDASKTQVLIPRRCWVFKKKKKEIPFKHLVWLCHGLELPRDLVLMPER